MKNRDVEIYSAYIQVKADPKGNVAALCREKGISRTHLYDVVDRVRNGNPARFKEDMEKARLELLWKHKYEARFLALPKDRKPGTIDELRAIIKGMEADEFPQLLIAKKLGKFRSTIIHHLTK